MPGNHPFCRIRWYLLLVGVAIACSKQPPTVVSPPPRTDTLIRAVDFSLFPEIERRGWLRHDPDDTTRTFPAALREYGVNAIRLRLWKDPAANSVHGLDSVAQFSARLRALGFKTWISVHYSDDWADPGQQQTPQDWQGLSFAELLSRVHAYTADVAQRIQPDWIQVGNEINHGMLWPQGDRRVSPQQFRLLLDTACAAIRRHAPGARIVLHYAGLDGSDAFFQSLSGVDYDAIGISYYPLWHGRNLQNLPLTLGQLHARHQKPVLIAETSYPFTLGWADLTTNIVGLDSQLIVPDFPASLEGQRNYMHTIRTLCRGTPGVSGYCYWGAEWVAYGGSAVGLGSPWENQALFDFEYRPVPALSTFADVY
jgi:arabinogalactan endo-1,4-beta-galactosidase